MEVEENESVWRVVKVRSEPGGRAKANQGTGVCGKNPVQGTERSQSQGLKDFTHLVGAPILKADDRDVTTRWAPDTTPDSWRDKIGEGLYLKTPSSLAPLPPGAHQKHYDLGDVGDWPSMGVEGALSAPQLHSWSKVVKKPAPVVTRHANKKEVPIEEEVISDEEREVTRKSRKKKKQKENPERAPLVLELADILQALELKKSKKIVVATGGGVALHQQPLKAASTVRGQEAQRSGNALDASAPTVRRGKERETPKKKRPSALRKVITKEKTGRKTILEETGQSETKLNDAEEGECTEDVVPTITLATIAMATTAPATTIHNRKFREYCDHVVTEEINECVEKLLTDLRSFQDRQYLKDPAKSKAKRRYVCGLKEVLKHLKLKKIKCVVMPPNLDKIRSEGGINDFVAQIVDTCKQLDVPVIFAMSRRRLAVLLRKKHQIGCVGIFYYDGAEVHYKRLMELIDTARLAYNDKVSCLSCHTGSILSSVLAVVSTESSDDSAPEEYADLDLALGGAQLLALGGAQLNIGASEFVPTNSQSLNVNAAVFTPAFVPSGSQ